VNTLDRYVLKEIAVPFGIAMALFYVVIAFEQILKVADSVTGLGLGAGDLMQALSFSFPPLMGLLIPISALFATLLGIGRLAADRELVALASCGGSSFRLLRVPMVAGVILGCVCAYAMIVGEPWGISGLKNLMASSAQKALARGVRVGEFNEWVTDVTFLAKGKQGEDLLDVMFADRRDQERPVVISAKKAQVKAGKTSKHIVFDLRDGSIVHYRPGSEGQRVIQFERSLYRLDVSSLVSNKLRTATAAQELGLSELRRRVDDPHYSKYERGLYHVTFHRKFALPVATLIFMILGVALGSRRGGHARASAFVISALVVGAYYYIGRAAELSARTGDFSAPLAAWLPDIIGAVCIVILLPRLRRTP